MSFSDVEYTQFYNAITCAYGYDFTNYAEASVRRRINQYMLVTKILSLEELEMLLIKDEKCFVEFVQQISVTVTEMFRDPSFFKSLRENAIKRLATYPNLKIWIAGCATGEEVYSIAILLQEEGLLDRCIIYGTDINQKSLQIAKEGIYSVAKMKEFTSNYQMSGGKLSFSEYYKSKYNSVMFNKSLKKNIVFAPHNLTADKSFSEFQLILCRNVLIYFNQKLQNDVIGLFYESLCPLGILALGNKESLLFSDKRKEFDEIDLKERIFIKRA